MHYIPSMPLGPPALTPHGAAPDASLPGRRFRYPILSARSVPLAPMAISMCLRCSGVSRPHPAISLSVRKQPSQRLVFGSTAQTLMQGERIGAG